jgi:hypothetical protein
LNLTARRSRLSHGRRGLAAVAGVAGPGYRALMKKLTGTIRRNDLEGGHWVLEADDGQTYQLVGSTTDCKDGQRVEVEGKVDKGGMGIGMTGPHFSVQSLKAV